MPLSSIREDARQYLIVDTVKRLNSRLGALERNVYSDLLADTLTLGNPISDVGGIGDLSMEGSLEVEGWVNVGTPITPAALEGDAAIEGDLSVGGTFSNTGVEAGLVTNGDAHNHDGGDGGTIGEGGVSFSGKLVTNGDSHNHSGGDGAAIPESGLATAVQDQLVTGGDSHTHGLPNDIEASSGMTVGATGKSPATGQIRIYSGSTWVGEISVSDTTWLRFNTNVAKNIYTPRYFRAENGLSAGNVAPNAGDVRAQNDLIAGSGIVSGESIIVDKTPDNGDINYKTNLRPERGSTLRTVYGFYPFTTKQTVWNGTGRSSGTGTVNVTSYGCPSGTMAIAVRLFCRDSAGHVQTSPYAAIGPSSSDRYAVAAYAHGDDMLMSSGGTCPVSSNLIYYQFAASGSGTLDVWLYIYGYYI